MKKIALVDEAPSTLSPVESDTAQALLESEGPGTPRPRNSARQAEDAKPTVRFERLDSESLNSEDARATVRFDRLDEE